MPTVREIEQALFALAPGEAAMEWDNVGQLLGDPDQQVERVLVALDITEAVAEEAIAAGCQLIVAHHPVMNCRWTPVQTIRSDTVQGHLFLKLLRGHVSVIGGKHERVKRMQRLQPPLRGTFCRSPAAGKENRTEHAACQNQKQQIDPPAYTYTFNSHISIAPFSYILGSSESILCGGRRILSAKSSV